MCVDFTNLNKACPQDPFPLPRIDHIVDSTAECDLLCFLDAFSGYHQIKLAVEDVEKTAFLTPCGVYCYTCMPFGLRNAGATFQWLMHFALGQHLRRNTEAYVDDIVVKSREARTLIQYLEETFASLRTLDLRLNPEKCVFGVPSVKMMGLLVSHKGIEANPEKVKAIKDMSPPQNLKEMQKLDGHMTSLGCFFGGARLAILQADEEEGSVQVDPCGRPGISRPQEIPDQPSGHGGSAPSRAPGALPRHHSLLRQRSLGGSQRGAPNQNRGSSPGQGRTGTRKAYRNRHRG